MRNYKSKILIIALLFLFLTSNFAFAASGLVPCGECIDSETINGVSVCKKYDKCEWNDLYTLIGRIINFMVEIAFALVALMIVYGGFVVMTAGDNSSRVQEGWKIIQAAVIGLLITLLAWTIMSTLIQALCSGKSVSFKPWEMVKNCTSESIPAIVKPTK